MTLVCPWWGGRVVPGPGLLVCALLAGPVCQVFGSEEERWVLHPRSLQSSRETDGEEVISRVMGL